MASLRTGLADPGIPPVQAALRILDGELSAMTSWLAAQDNPVQVNTAIRRFGALIQATPSLRAYQSDMMDPFVEVAADILAERARLSPGDPERGSRPSPCSACGASSSTPCPGTWTAPATRPRSTRR